MARISTVILILSSLCVLTQSLRLNFDQGKVSFRTLETTATTSNEFINHTNNTAVTAKFSEDYIQRADLADKQTDFAIYLFTNVTGFCKDCPEFIPFACEEKDCNAELDSSQDMMSHNYYVDSGNYISQSVSLGSSWNLNTPAYFFQKRTRSHCDVDLDGSSQGYLKDNTTYGFIGLGVSGDSFKNFDGHPLFSLQVNTSGKGQLIFAEDKTLYNSTRTPLKVSTNGNWSLPTKNFTWGPNVTVPSFSSRLAFDLQHPGIALPDTFYNYIIDELVGVYNITRRKDTTEDFSYVYHGKISQLPNISIGISDTEKLVLPPTAFTRKLSKHNYLILVSPLYSVYNTLRGESVAFTVLGWPVLSQFYTVFEAQDEKTATVTLHPTYALNWREEGEDPTPSNFMPTLVKVGLGALVVMILVCLACKWKSKQTDKLQDELGNFYGEGQTAYTRASNDRSL